MNHQTNLPSVCPHCASKAIQSGVARVGPICREHGGWQSSRNPELAPRQVLNAVRRVYGMAWGKL